MAFDNASTNAMGPAWLGTTPKKYDLPLFSAAFERAIHRWKALNLGSLNMQFQQDWQKDKKNYSSFKFLPENRKILLDLSFMMRL